MTTPLLQVGKFARAKYKTVQGMEFYGQFLSIPDTSRVSNFLSARRYLRTVPNTPLLPRMVMVAEGLKYIVAEHGTGFYVVPIYKHFKLFEVDMEAQWRQTSFTENPVTGVKEQNMDETGPTIYLSTQPHSVISDTLNIPNPVKTAITNADVKVDDIVGGYVVIKSDVVLGVNLIEMKEL